MCTTVKFHHSFHNLWYRHQDTTEVKNSATIINKIKVRWYDSTVYSGINLLCLNSITQTSMRQSLRLALDLSRRVSNKLVCHVSGNKCTCSRHNKNSRSTLLLPTNYNGILHDINRSMTLTVWFCFTQCNIITMSITFNLQNLTHSVRYSKYL